MKVNITSLDNGLTVVSETMPHLQTATVGVWVGVGARDERADQNGVSHMLEHMAFKGTSRRDAYAIAAEIEAVGGHLNAYTSRENTAYYAKVLKDDMPLATDIIADILQHSAFDPAELERERTVILQEIGQAEDTPDDIIFDHFQETAFPNQSMGRPILGSAELVRSFSRDQVAGYMSQHYAAPGMVLAATGNLDHAALIDLAETHFTGLSSDPATLREAAAYQGGDFRKTDDLEQVHFLLGFDGASYAAEDYYPVSVLATLLGGGMSSRLFQEIREKRGLVYSIYSFASSFSDSGMFGVYAGTSPSDIAELAPVVCDELMKVTQSVEDEEVDRAKAQLKASIMMSMESSGSRCEQIARQWQIFGRILGPEEILAHINEVDASMVIAAARRVFASRPTVAAMGDLRGLESYDQITARLS